MSNWLRRQWQWYGQWDWQWQRIRNWVILFLAGRSVVIINATVDFDKGEVRVDHPGSIVANSHFIAPGFK